MVPRIGCWRGARLRGFALASLVLGVSGAWSLADQSAPASPEPRAVLAQAIRAMSSYAMDRSKVDWAALELELSGALGPDAQMEHARAAITRALERLGDKHASLRPPPAPAPSLPGGGGPANAEEPAAPAEDPEPDAQPAADPALSPARRVPILPEGRMLEGGVAYLVIPGCSAPDVDGLRAFAGALSRTINELERTHQPRGWLIDLRLNGGGNLWPMLLGAAPFLEEGTLMTMVEGERVLSRFGRSRSSVWIDWGNGPEVQLEHAAPADEPTTVVRGRVGVLLGPWTMSSGEALAICLSGRDGTRTFGEPTAGLTTVTNTYPLDDGSVLILSVSEMGDAGGIRAGGPIRPMQEVALGDWPTAEDQAARAALDWIAHTSP